MRKKLLVLSLSVGMLLVNLSASFAGTKAIMDQVCTLCHKVERPFSKKKTRAEWEATVNRMAGRNQAITPEYKAEIVDFLSRVRNSEALVHTAGDPSNLNEMEQLHLPVLNAPLSVEAHAKAKVEVQIGEKPHPMQEDHHIYAVDIYVNNWWTDMVELEPGQEPKATFNPAIHVNSALEIVVHCTQDGDWSAKSEIKVEE